MAENGDECFFAYFVVFGCLLGLSASSGLLGGSSIDSGQLDILGGADSLRPANPKFIIRIFRFGINIFFFELVNAEKLMCSSYFGILLILRFSGRDQAACRTACDSDELVGM